MSDFESIASYIKNGSFRFLDKLFLSLPSKEVIFFANVRWLSKIIIKIDCSIFKKSSKEILPRT
jgi:hypothetical protein